MPTSVGPDGIAVTGLGWTNQSTLFQSNLNLESYGNVQSGVVNPPFQYGYLGWSMIPEDAIVAPTHPLSNQNILTRIYVPEPGVTTKCDIFPVQGTGVTSANVGLYNSLGVQVAVATPIAAAFTANSQLTFTWTTPFTLSGNTFYYAALVVAWATTAPTLAGGNFASPASLNANLTVSAPEAATNVTSATLPASYTMASNVLVSFEYFIAFK